MLILITITIWISNSFYLVWLIIFVIRRKKNLAHSESCAISAMVFCADAQRLMLPCKDTFIRGRVGVTFQIARASRQHKCERECKQVSAGSVFCDLFSVFTLRWNFTRWYDGCDCVSNFLAYEFSKVFHLSYCRHVSRLVRLMRIFLKVMSSMCRFDSRTIHLYYRETFCDSRMFVKCMRQ